MKGSDLILVLEKFEKFDGIEIIGINRHTFDEVGYYSAIIVIIFEICLYLAFFHCINFQRTFEFDGIKIKFH